jgi:translation initiation factor 5
MVSLLACGKKTLADMSHKMVAFILKNPPKSGSGYGTAASASNASSNAKKPKKGKRVSADDDEEDDIEEQEVVVEAEVLPTEKVQQPHKSSLDDWSEEPTGNQLDKLNANMENLLLDDSAGDDPFEKLAAVVESNPAVTLSEILATIKEYDLREDKAVAVLVQVIFTEQILAELPKKKAIFQKLLSSGEKSQKAFLGGVERLVGVKFPALMPKVAHILKSAYDLDLLDEEVILAWGEKPSKKYVEKSIAKEIRKKADPFLKWLKEAEEESDDESE